ncbi:hypothetical protein HDU87_000466 [Geranomyces variabilis]|uniref:Fe2OG dioxygenase domain-containing protein n=1 Tax=Geranomyces variabilis TaxID=109894 RepID=A0AAD5THT6_9FUNG|nr:hypothetical protein HDU87_000466 [Geranomyces variabilis]
MPPLLTLLMLWLIRLNLAAGDTLAAASAANQLVCWLTIDPRRGPPDPVLDGRYSSFVQNTSFDFTGLSIVPHASAFVVEDLLAPDEIAQIMRSARATTLGTPRTKNGVVVDDAWKRSDAAGEIWIPQDSASVLLDRIRPMLGRRFHFFGTTPYLRGVARVSLYQPGGRFRPHFDGPYVAAPRLSRWPGDTSWYTLLIYLNTPTSGGATRFANVESWKKLDVVPRAGRGVVFGYDMLHCGMAVGEGAEKWVLKMDLMIQNDRARMCNGCID